VENFFAAAKKYGPSMRFTNHTRNATALLCLVFAQMAMADPIVAPNTLEIIGFDGNLIDVRQSSQDGHRAVLIFSDSGNGAPSDANSESFDWFGPLPAGILRQSGKSQSAELTISGAENVFSIIQSGHGNEISGRISGMSNMVVIQQTGASNTAIFTQTGHGNRLSVDQSM
jgi:hypothetical protein